MTQRTFADWQRLMDLEPSDFEQESTERILETAIGLLNLYGADLPKMTGDYNNKLLNCTDEEWTAIAVLARFIYTDFVEDSPGDFTIQGLDLEARNYLTDPEALKLIQELAERVQALNKNPYDNIILV